MKIGEDRRETAPISLPPLRFQRLPIEQDLPVMRPIETGQQAGQRRLAAAVATDQEHLFTTFQRQVDGADLESPPCSPSA